MKVMLDTNIILDVFLKREPFFKVSYEILKQSANGTIESLLSASAVTDIYYLLKKQLKDDHQVRTHLAKLFQIVMLADVQAVDLQNALNSAMDDFEDAVVSEVAFRHRANYIITRNTKDFEQSIVPAATPNAFLSF